MYINLLIMSCIVNQIKYLKCIVRYKWRFVGHVCYMPSPFLLLIVNVYFQTLHLRRKAYHVSFRHFYQCNLIRYIMRGTAWINIILPMGSVKFVISASFIFLSQNWTRYQHKVKWCLEALQLMPFTCCFVKRWLPSLMGHMISPLI